MSGSTIDTAVKILDECRARIQANMAKRYRTSHGERWINASGRSAAAFQVVTEGGGTLVRLVYRGDDVAPLASLQTGTTGVPPVSVLSRWLDEKGLDLNPWAVRANIKKRGGTERHFEPQDWVVGPEVEAAVAALNDQIPAAAARAVRDLLFK